MNGPGRDDFTELEAMFGRPRPDASARTRPHGFEERDPYLPDPRQTETPVVTAADAAAARTRRFRRRAVAASIALVVVAIVGTYIPVTLLAPVPVPTVSLNTPAVALPTEAALTLPPAMESAVSITGGDDFEALTGTKEMVGTSGGDRALPIASISKLISALVILDRKPLSSVDDLGPTLTFSKADHDLYDKYYVLGASIQPMKTGSQMNERDVLKTMLIVSACNYAEAAATWAYGSQDAFVAATKKWLSGHGLSNTRIVEPTGVDPRNISTPGDLVALGKIAHADPVVSKIVAMAKLNVPEMSNIGNNNDLLGIDGVDGIKTGTLDDSGSNLLFSAAVDIGRGAPVSVIGVVLGGASRDEVDSAVRMLIKSLKGGFHEVPLIEADTTIGTYSTAWGDRATVVTESGTSLFTWSNQAITAKVNSAPVRHGKSGTVVGEIEFASPTNQAQVPLVLRGAIREPDAWWRLTHPQRLFAH